jgi:ParB family chromosome partitioning protein
LQRQDLDFIEEARGVALLMEKWNLSQEQTAKFLGKSQSAVANKLRLLKHSQPVLEELRRRGLTERHARALLKLPSENQKMAVIATIAQLDMNVARTEQYIESLLQDKTPREKKPNVGAFIQNLTQALSKIQLSGISAVSERKETENEIVLTITFPK